MPISRRIRRHFLLTYMCGTNEVSDSFVPWASCELPTGRSQFVGNLYEAYGTNELLTSFVPHMYVQKKCLRIILEIGI